MDFVDFYFCNEWLKLTLHERCRGNPYGYEINIEEIIREYSNFRMFPSVLKEKKNNRAVHLRFLYSSYFFKICPRPNTSVCIDIAQYITMLNQPNVLYLSYSWNEHSRIIDVFKNRLEDALKVSSAKARPILRSIKKKLPNKIDLRAGSESIWMYENILPDLLLLQSI
jgi:hypothetical protein